MANINLDQFLRLVTSILKFGKGGSDSTSIMFDFIKFSNLFPTMFVYTRQIVYRMLSALYLRRSRSLQ